MRTKQSVRTSPCFLLAFVTAASPSFAAGPPLQQIEEASSQSRRLMQSKVMLLTLDEYDFRDRTKPLESLASRLAEDDLDADDRAMLNTAIEKLANNKARTVQTTYSCDGVARVYKAVSVPTTDGALGAGKTVTRLAGFDAKGEVVVAELVTGHGKPHLLVNRHPTDRAGACKPHVNAGIVEPDFFRMAKEVGAQAVPFTNGQGRDLLQITCIHSGMKVVVVVDPALDYRMTSMEGRTLKGQLFVREEFGDYIEQEGTLFPSIYHIVRWNPETGQVTREKRFEVIDADLNASFANGELAIQIPSGTSVLDHTSGPKPRVFKSRRDASLSWIDIAAAIDPGTGARISDAFALDP